MAADYRVRSSGPGNAAWRGGKWKYKGRGWRVIRDRVLLRDGYSCQNLLAAVHSSSLLVHHKIPQRFFLWLDDANSLDNLVSLCGRCHPRRPEHFWVSLPTAFFVEGVHSVLPPERTRLRLRPYPICSECGSRCKRHRSQFCSYSCSAKARWKAGLYGSELSKNFGGKTRWTVPGLSVEMSR
jgi:5-methylcytosine-specific restriction endonuclease McrA